MAGESMLELTNKARLRMEEKRRGVQPPIVITNEEQTVASLRIPPGSVLSFSVADRHEPHAVAQGHREPARLRLHPKRETRDARTPPSSGFGSPRPIDEAPVIVNAEECILGPAAKATSPPPAAGGCDAVVLEFFTCLDCRMNWLCQACVQKCHADHRLAGLAMSQAFPPQALPAHADGPLRCPRNWPGAGACSIASHKHPQDGATDASRRGSPQQSRHHCSCAESGRCVLSLDPYSTQLAVLREMGFDDSPRLSRLLAEKKGSVEAALRVLCGEGPEL